MDVPRLTSEKFRTGGLAFVRTHARLLLAALVAALAVLGVGRALLAQTEYTLSVVLEAPLDGVGHIPEDAAVDARFRVYFNETVPNDAEVVVSVQTVNGSALAGSDYTANTEVLTFTGEIEKFFYVEILDDVLDEPNEYFTVEASVTTTNNFNGVFSEPSDREASVTAVIADNEAPGFNSISPATQSVPEATGAVSFTLNLSSSTGGETLSPQQVTLFYELTGVNPLPAANPADDLNPTFVTTGTWTIEENTASPGGQASVEVGVPIVDDLLDEADEEFQLEITGVANLVTGTLNPVGQTVNFTLIDSDEAEVSVATTSPVTVTEQTPLVTVPVTLSLSLTPSAPVTVTYAVEGPPTSTVELSDYALNPASEVVFNTGETTKVVEITVNDDAVFEPTERLVLRLTGATGGTVSPTNNTFTLDIQEDTTDTPPTISVGDVEQAEGTTFTFTPTLALESEVDAVFNYSLTPGTATQDVDYTDTSGTLTITAGLTQTTLAVIVPDDSTYELTETFTLNLTPVSGISGGATAEGRIVDNDTAPTLSIGDVQQAEGTGTVSTTFTFTPTLSAVSEVDAVFVFDTPNVTATAPADFQYTTDVVTITAGLTQTTITVPVVADSTFEPDEDFRVSATAISGIDSGAGDLEAVGTILNDDTAPTLSIEVVPQLEGTGSVSTTFLVTPTLSAPSDVEAIYQFSLTPDTATPGVDYLDAGGSANFPIRSTQGSLALDVAADSLFENTEAFTITLTPVSGISGEAVSARVEILNDDTAPTLSVGNVSQLEGTGSVSTTFTFTPTLSAESGVDAVFNYSLTPGSATSPDDYADASGTLTITVGSTQTNLTVDIVADSTYELSETFTLNLTPVSGISGGNVSAQAEIVNDDALPEISISDVSVNEGNAGTFANAVFTVTLSTASGAITTVKYATADNTATLADNDYVQVTTSTLEIGAGELTGTFTVTVNGDNDYESDETFFVNLANPTNATIAAGEEQATGTIIDDDLPSVQFTSGSSSVNEADVTVSTSVVVTLTNQVIAGDTITVNVSLANGTPPAENPPGYPPDYTVSTSLPLVFTTGEISKAISLDIAGDLLYENDEQVVLTIDSAEGATVTGQTNHILTIIDNDQVPLVGFQATDSSKREDELTATIPVTLSAATGLTVTVDYRVTGGTAVGGGVDYTLADGTLTLIPGQDSADLVVDLIDDSLPEATEFVTITLSNPLPAEFNLALGRETHTLSITDNDAPPDVEFVTSNSSIDEDAGTVDIGVRLTGEAGAPITVDFAEVGTPPTGDYSFATSSPLNFPVGTTLQTITVNITPNTAYDGDRTLQIGLSNPGGLAGINVGSINTHTLRIDDNDGPTVTFASASASIDENDPSGQYVVNLTLSDPIIAGETASLQLLVSGTAADGTDFIVPTSVVFNAGETGAQRAITIQDDQLDEANETVILDIQIPDGENLRPGTTTRFELTIVDDDESPVVQSDTYTVAEDTPLSVPAGIGVLENDTDADGDALTAVGLTQTTNGTLTFNSDGSFTYVPNANFFGTDSFTYRASDGTNESNDIATVTITVTAVNDTPQAVTDSFVVVNDRPYLLEVLANDTDVDNDTLTVTQVSQPIHGSVSITNNGANVTYTASPGYLGPDAFTYTVCDNGTPQLCAQNITVNITVSLGKVYLPWVSQGVAPDLVVKSVSINPSKAAFQAGQAVAGNAVEITVVVENQGTGVTDRQFWVDLYIDPQFPAGQVMPRVNQRWNDLCPADASLADPCYYGIVWLVEQSLAPGESLTLTSNSIADTYSRWPGYFISGTDDLYVLVDSWNPGFSAGAIGELVEDNNGNSLLDIGVSGNNPFLLANLPEEIPARPRP